MLLCGHEYKWTAMYRYSRNIFFFSEMCGVAIHVSEEMDLESYIKCRLYCNVIFCIVLDFGV